MVPYFVTLVSIKFILLFHDTHGINQYPKFILSIHSSKRISLRSILASDYLLADAIIKLTISVGQQDESRKGITAYYLSKNWSGLVVVIENRHDDKWIHIKCNCLESTNVVSTRGHLYTVDSIPPLMRQVIAVLTQLDGSIGFSISYNLTHRLSNTDGLHDWGPMGENHVPCLNSGLTGLHSPRPL